MDEIWKDVAGYEGLYQVSNFGRVKSLERIIFKKDGKFQKTHESIRKQVLIKGYCRVVFCNKSKVNMPIHRLVAIAFIDNPENKKYVNHIDGNKQNNHIENIEWVTASENGIHSYNLGLSLSCENHSSAKLKNCDIKNILTLHKNGMKQTEISKVYNMTPAPINAIIKGRTWKHIK